MRKVCRLPPILDEITPDDENPDENIDGCPDSIDGEDGGFLDENGDIVPQIDDNENSEDIIDGENGELLPESEDLDDAGIVPAE